MFKLLNPKDRLIFPLDLPSWEEALPYVKQLSEEVGWFKVGLELFVAEGPDIIAKIKDIAPQNHIFLDLKLHDIPATVGRAMEAASKLGADLVTVHAQGGEDMLRAAVKSAGNSKVLAITVLTSLNTSEFEELTPEFREAKKWAFLLAKRAQKAGCHGLVSSGYEVSFLREKLGNDIYLIVPGIRPTWAVVKSDDQSRIMTPIKAIKAGADLIVVGRPIRDASDPKKAAAKIVEEIANI